MQAVAQLLAPFAYVAPAAAAQPARRGRRPNPAVWTRLTYNGVHVGEINASARRNRIGNYIRDVTGQGMGCREFARALGIVPPGNWRTALMATVGGREVVVEDMLAEMDRAGTWVGAVATGCGYGLWLRAVLRLCYAVPCC